MFRQTYNRTHNQKSKRSCTETLHAAQHDHKEMLNNSFCAVKQLGFQFVDFVLKADVGASQVLEYLNIVKYSTITAFGAHEYLPASA